MVEGLYRRRPAIANGPPACLGALALCTLAAACADAQPVAASAVGSAVIQATMHSELGREFQLRNTESATIGSGGLTLRFDAVTRDGRCPVGDPCAEGEGDATVQVTLRQLPREASTIELHSDPAVQTEAAYLQYRVRLVRLEPRPVGEQPVPLSEYRGTFVVSTEPIPAS